MSVNWQDHDDYPELALNAESRGEYIAPSEMWRGIAMGAGTFAAIVAIAGIGIWIWRSVR